MGLFDLFSPKAPLTGEVSVDGLPPHSSLIANPLFLQVPNSKSPPELDHRHFKDICVKEAGDPETWPLQFAVHKRFGHYYVGLSVILFQDHQGKRYAQVERFFPMQRPYHHCKAASPLALTVRWPDIPLDQMGTYGTMYPTNWRSGLNRALVIRGGSCEISCGQCRVTGRWESGGSHIDRLDAVQYFLESGWSFDSAPVCPKCDQREAK